MTFKLPSELSRPIYSEFDSRFKEAKRVISRYDNYQSLRDDLDVVENLLALSVFYNRVIVNLDSATKFFGRVTNTQQAIGVKIGNYILNNDEILIVRRVILSYQKLMRNYNLVDSMWNYQLTIDFLKTLIRLKDSHNDRESS